jgi:hypothetical protein
MSFSKKIDEWMKEAEERPESAVTHDQPISIFDFGIVRIFEGTCTPADRSGTPQGWR